jgi:hypothetical protein
MPETAAPLAYGEPTVMWRMRRPNGLSSHALIIPCPDGAIVAWFVNDRPIGHRQVPDLASAIRVSDQMQAQNWAVGWRLVTDERDGDGTRRADSSRNAF